MYVCEWAMLCRSTKDWLMGNIEDYWQNVVHWRREWQPTPVFLPRESHGQYERQKIWHRKTNNPRLESVSYATGEEQRAITHCSRKNEVAFPVAQSVKNLPAMQETWVQFLGWEDPWRRKWQPTPVFLPGKSHGLRSLVGYSLWGCKELDTTERLTHTHKKEWHGWA